MSAEFSHILTVAEIGQGRTLSLSADQGQRDAVAKRLDLIEIKSLRVEAKLASIAGGVKLAGELTADLVQHCAATHLPVPARVKEAFDLRFLLNFDGEISADDEDAEIEIEISSEDCENLPLEDGRIDVGEAAVQSLSLALDPFPRHPDADKFLTEKGVLQEDQTGPFAALAALKKN